MRKILPKVTRKIFVNALGGGVDEAPLIEIQGVTSNVQPAFAQGYGLAGCSMPNSERIREQADQRPPPNSSEKFGRPHPTATLTSKQGRLEDQLKVAPMKTVKPKGRRTTQYELVERAWLTLETSEELIQERRAQEEKLERYIELRRQQQLRDGLK